MLDKCRKAQENWEGRAMTSQREEKIRSRYSLRRKKRCRIWAIIFLGRLSSTLSRRKKGGLPAGSFNLEQSLGEMAGGGKIAISVISSRALYEATVLLDNLC
jgi:hypothetical protein